jgi:hypothetical protein
LQLSRDGEGNARRKRLIPSRIGRNPHARVQEAAHLFGIAISTMWRRLTPEMAMKPFHLSRIPLQWDVHYEK